MRQRSPPQRKAFAQSINNSIVSSLCHPSFYDLIVTGDLGKLGKEVIFDFFQKDGIELTNYDDCGTMIFDLKKGS